MPDDQSCIKFSPFQAIRPPKGSHLIRVYSLTNRNALELYYRTQVAEWARLEFDNNIVCYESVNQVFEYEGKHLFVAFKVGYLHGDFFSYINEPNKEGVVHAFESYCAARNSLCKPLGNEVLSAAKVELWNRIKILSMISKWEDQITSANIKKFISLVEDYPFISLGEIEKIEEFSGGCSMAFAFELVRMGKYKIKGLCEQPITRGTLVQLNSKGI